VKIKPECFAAPGVLKGEKMTAMPGEKTCHLRVKFHDKISDNLNSLTSVIENLEDFTMEVKTGSPPTRTVAVGEFVAASPILSLTEFLKITPEKILSLRERVEKITTDLRSALF
jgi:hypothetical protein